MSPLIVPVDTVRLRVSNTNTRASPAAANGSRRKSQTLEHSRHLEVPRARLRPGKHAPQSTPVRLKAHWKSGFSVSLNVTAPILQ